MSLIGGRRRRTGGRKTRRAGSRAVTRALVPLGFMAMAMRRSKRKHNSKKHGTRKGMRRKTARRAYKK
jgi:hypothetical protein